jgi:hypothetical protein
MSNTIIIRWRNESVEYITIDFEHLEKHPNIRSTHEVWVDGTEVTYNTSSVVQPLKNGIVRLDITYKKKDNVKIPEGARFGVSTILFKAPYKKGTAKWVDISDRSYNGTCNWKKANDGLKKTKKPILKTIKQLERHQAQFRGLLLSIDGCCAITKERTECSLEAAHIIPSKNGGAETEENGILPHRVFLWVTPTSCV